ncbi:hypothetical protein DF19_29685 [Streptomyces olindensis]|nr:hypothetical protein DF19_29685 [Streptomyces olindensis]
MPATSSWAYLTGEASEGASAIAAEIHGFTGSHVGELVGTPLTAHFLGGCPIGSSRETAVPAEAFGALRLPFLGVPKVPSTK